MNSPFCTATPPPSRSLPSAATAAGSSSAGDDRTIVVWDTGTRQRVATLSGHGARVRGLAFTAAGTLISGAEDGRIVSWSFDLRAARAQICAAAGRELTRQEWATHIPSEPYDPSCGAPPHR
ncbi:hypothetical protein AB0283_17225 [Micromonospora vinacea]|uniref:WD40 repeat domain-containing protein n=1 Tax=Micromonospora vinacea TaxID=709878 RepID=UPI00344B4C68